MATKFLVWADKDCNGTNIQWKQISGFEFFKLIKQPENKNRFFIKLPAEEWYEDEIFIEATQEQYADWKKEENHKAYINKENQKFQTVSQYRYSHEDDEMIDVIETISDENQKVAEIVEKAIISNQLHFLLNQLTMKEFEIISLFSEGKSWRFIASELDMSKGAVQYQLEKILQNLQKKLVQN